MTQGTLSQALNNSSEKAQYPDEKPLVGIDLSLCDEDRRARAVHLINTVARNSALGKSLLETVAEQGYRLTMTPSFGCFGSACEAMKTLSLSTLASDDRLMQVLSHEARHIRQYADGIDSEASHYVFKGAVMAHRAKEADAETASAAVCYEMKQSGVAGPWAEFETEVPEVAKAFLSAAKGDERTATPAMLRAGFEGWYDNEERLRGYEKGALHSGLNASWDERNDPASYYAKPLSSRQIVEAICRDAAGKCYWAQNPDVLEQPQKLAVTEATVKKCEQAFLIRKSGYNLEEDKTYKTLPLREELKAQKQKAAPVNTVSAGTVARLAAAKRAR